MILSRYREAVRMGSADPEYYARAHDFGGGGGSAPEPDPGIAEAQKANAEIAKEALQFSKDQWAELAPWREWQFATSQKAADAAINTMELQNQIAQEMWSFYSGTFKPLEQQIVAEAKAYDTPERQEKEAARSIAQVGQSFAASRENMGLDMARYGIKPEDAQLDRSRLAEAGLTAVAANEARRNVEETGYARKMNAAQIGRGLPANQAAAAGLGLNAGNAASGNALAAGGSTLQSSQLMNQGYATAIGANTAAGNLGLGMYQGAQSAYNADQQRKGQESAGIGQLVGTAAGLALAFSSKDAKTSKTPLAEGEALSKIKEVPVEKWRYKAGVEDSGAAEHVGPYAEDMNASFGENMAPGGKAINVADEAGLALAGIKALAEKVERIEQKIGL